MSKQVQNDRPPTGEALLNLIYAAALNDAEIPIAAQAALKAAVMAYQRADAVSMDEALGLARPKGWHQQSARLRSRYRWQVYMAVREATHFGRIKQGDAEALFQGIVDRLGLPISWSAARKFYNEQRKRVADYRKTTKT